MVSLRTRRIGGDREARGYGSLMANLARFILSFLRTSLRQSNLFAFIKHLRFLLKLQYVMDLIIKYNSELEGNFGFAQLMSTIQRKIQVTSYRAVVPWSSNTCLVCRRGRSSLPATCSPVAHRAHCFLRIFILHFYPSNVLYPFVLKSENGKETLWLLVHVFQHKAMRNNNTLFIRRCHEHAVCMIMTCAIGTKGDKMSTHLQTVGRSIKQLVIRMSGHVFGKSINSKQLPREVPREVHERSPARTSRQYC